MIRVNPFNTWRVADTLRLSLGTVHVLDFMVLERRNALSLPPGNDYVEQEELNWRNLSWCIYHHRSSEYWYVRSQRVMLRPLLQYFRVAIRMMGSCIPSSLYPYIPVSAYPCNCRTRHLMLPKQILPSTSHVPKNRDSGAWPMPNNLV